MRIRVFVYALLALGAALPAAARGAVTLNTTTIQAPVGDVPAGSTLSVICRAEGDTSGMAISIETTINRADVAVTDSLGNPAGTVTPAQLTTVGPHTCVAGRNAGVGQCSWLEGSASWATPAAAGTYTATCTVTYTNTTSVGSTTGLTVSSTASVTTVVPTLRPPVVGTVTGPADVVVNTSATYEVAATDPDGRPLSYAWTATGGTIAPDASNPARARWQAPSTPGAYQINVAVNDYVFTVNAQKSVNAVFAAYQANLPLPLSAPRRLAEKDGIGVFVVDGDQSAGGRILLATARGEARGFASLPEPALAVATGAGFLWVTTTTGHVYKVDPVTGRNLGQIPLVDGPFLNPFGIAYNPSTMTLWVADKDANRVRVITPDGATVAIINQSAPGARLTEPVDVAIDEARGRVYVLVFQAKDPGILAPGEPVAAARFLHAFDLSGQYLASYVSPGGALGQLSRAGGLAVGASAIYLSDIYQGVVQVLSPTATPIATVGTWGQAEGQLTNPMGLALLANGDLMVANSSLGRIERFGNGSALPTCAGDSDCDLLPDAWEIANGYDPNWAGNSLLDLDGDGLNNAQELAAGTNPNNRDTDGDGYSDGDELATGFDPLNPNDHKALVAVTAPSETPPGLVKLRATATAPDPCTVAWTQAPGTNVVLTGAGTSAPSFIARAAGTYAFDAVATCGAQQSPPSRATIVVKNVAPLPEAGGVIVATPGAPVRLDALASSDANGDPLAFTWDQTLGIPIIASQPTGAFTARARGAGLYTFQVTVSDGAGATSTAEVPVLVADGQPPTAVAAALPAETQVGTTVVLDASTSIGATGASFSWQKVAGPAATLSGDATAVASFVPGAAGRYVFEVTVGTGAIRSPPARVEVFVAAAGGALPTVTATVPSIVAVGQPVSLEATASPASAQVRWRQVSGPAAGLTEADALSATVVPFVAGFHVFEVAVTDGASEGRPTRIAFEARNGAAIPQAVVTTAPGDAWVGQLVLLDGRGSTGAARFRWTQVAGPWVALGLQGSVASFRPLVPGAYAFELVVDDGTTRSAPSRIEVNVVSAGGVQ